MGPTADEQMLRYLFTACIEASQILGTDEVAAHLLAAEGMSEFASAAPTSVLGAAVLPASGLI